MSIRTTTTQDLKDVSTAFFQSTSISLSDMRFAFAIAALGVLLVFIIAVMMKKTASWRQDPGESTNDFLKALGLFIFSLVAALSYIAFVTVT